MALKRCISAILSWIAVFTVFLITDNLTPTAIAIFAAPILIFSLEVVIKIVSEQKQSLLKSTLYGVAYFILGGIILLIGCSILFYYSLVAGYWNR